MSNIRMTRIGLLALASGLLTACATPSTKQVDLAPELVQLEEARQRQMALDAQHQHQKRLSDLAYPLLTGAISLCTEDRAPLMGMHFRNVYSWENEAWRNAARGALGIGDSIEVVAVANGSAASHAGIRPGDVLLQVGDHHVGEGKVALKGLTEWVEEFKKSGTDHLPVVIRRGDERRELSLDGIPQACDYPAQVVADNSLNAFADGESIYVTSGMMRFAEDDELKVVLAHELAHNAAGHIDARKTNAILGAIVGAVADVAAAAGGVNTGGAYTSQGAQAGAQAYSQDFEREADYIGMYAMALAGYEYSESPEFWRHMASANPGSIALASTHPTTAERFVRLEYTVQELDGKRAAGDSLRPDPEEVKAKSYAGPDGASFTFQEGEYQHPRKRTGKLGDDREKCAEQLLEKSTSPTYGKSALTGRALHQCLTEEMGWSPARGGGF